MNNSPPKGKAAGGFARARALSPAERSAISRRAAQARWEDGDVPQKLDKLYPKLIALKVDEDTKALYARISALGYDAAAVSRRAIIHALKLAYIDIIGFEFPSALKNEADDTEDDRDDVGAE